MGKVIPAHFFLALFMLLALAWVWTHRYSFKIVRRLLGGEWQKVWYNRQHQGGYEIWERRRPNFDWESVGGRVIEEETK